MVLSRNCCGSGDSIMPSLCVVDLHDVEFSTTNILWPIDTATNDRTYLFLHVNMSDICQILTNFGLFSNLIRALFTVSEE